MLDLKPHDPPTPITHWFALFAGTWAVYLADRLLDVTRAPEPPATRRHQWAARHRRALGILLAGVLSFGVFLLPQIDRALWIRGGCFSAVVLLYFLLFRWWRLRLRFFPLKEALIGAVFAMGPAAVSGRPLAGLAWPVAAMAVLFAGNCLLIARAEREIDARADPSAYYAIPTGFRRWPEACFLGAALLAGLGCKILIAPVVATLLACAVASLGLAFTEGHGKIREVQAAADGILLLPWLALLVDFLTKVQGG